MKKILYLIAVSTLLCAACKKQALVENTVYEKIQPGDPKYSYIKILNVTPNSPTVNFFVDGTKFSAGLSSLGVENAGYNYATATSLFPDLGYATTTPGSHKLTAKIIASAKTDAGLEVFNTSINPQAGKYYTIFTTGQYNTTTKQIPSSLVVEDIKPALDTSKVFVRVINLYDGSPNVDLIKGDVPTGPKIISNVAYGTSSGWAEVPNPGSGTAPSIKYLLYNTATGGAVIAGTFTLSLSKGRAYTLYLKGVVGNTAFPPTITSYTTFY
ncbi:DUF4397 domain-containing protein [Pedobacter suwonensis]|uniref:DUF4397 domain-containing protein n=1 Tax=Pedobacter suwonensis TaxID=332999 RepID=UPI0025D8AA0B|nr:DUF4397 domain-containing protein [uncultured Pedobacter sp.]